MNQKLNFLILLTLISLTSIGCPGGGGGGGGAAFALLGMGGGGGDVPAPKLEIVYNGVSRESGATLDLGSEPINTAAGKTGTVTIKNSGTASISLPGSPNIVVLSGTDAAQFSITQPSKSTLEAGASVTFTLNFKPTTTGVKTATIKIQSSDAAVGSFQMNLTGTAGPAAPRLAVSVGATDISSNGSYGLGSVEVDSSGSAVTFTVSNTGSATATLDSPAVTSSDSQFVLNLAGFPATIAANASATFTIQFSPSSTGSKTSNIAVAYDGASAFLFTATGTGTPKPVPTISISHNSSSFTSGGSIPTFGVVWPTLTSSTKTVTISNTGTATMTGITLSKPSGHTGDFTISAFSAGATLAAGASGTFTIQFAPSATGARAAVVRVATTNGNNGAASSADLNVSGTGKTGADVLVSWTATNEKTANDTDGGYKVCYSQTSGFTAVHNGTSVICADVPNAGGTTPNSKVISVPNFGNWYFKVYSYGKYNTTGGTPSAQTSAVNVPST
ncbi:choice-of-anchor D domain-containing protein [Leptospira kanakyensis]|uniref:Choice-of-anchor D domain-containing protein n=2 Tax=Leptospira kanakyensis TaxID=2484968 RepID=A0A6N4QK69_9LEPT|nr:choice-of-anchor D domain-containing protein [Leptospira kanakyensis]TGK59165.1 choice-of-anchor D domain-containing protein [Leptospira kanakyensis]TGK75345.1 choice-of-anchor D domain-containing protein [Leptospira kanakyensis]